MNTPRNRKSSASTRPTRPVRPQQKPVDSEVRNRQIKAAAIGIVVLIVAILLIKGCKANQSERNLKSYVANVSSLIAESDEAGDSFFKLLRDPGDNGATDIETALNEQRSQAEEHVRRAKTSFDPPGDLSAANGYLVDVLEFRRDGLAEIAALIAPALGDQGRNEAIDKIAAQMQNFLTSDVIFSQRVIPAIVAELKAKRLPTNSVPQSRFLRSLDWLDPTTIDDVLSRARGGSTKAATPGTHGSGLVGVKVLPSGTVLQAGTPATLTGAESIEVELANQGENDETNVIVSVTISGAGPAIKLEKEVAAIARGESAKVEIPLSKTPPSGQSVSLRVEVQAVPGEKETTNNRETYSVTFAN